MKYFLVYNDWAELVETLPMEERGRVLTALFRHANGEEELGITDPAAKMLVMMMTKQMDRDTEAYDRKCERNKKNSNKRFIDGQRQTSNDIERYRPISTDNDGHRTVSTEYERIRPYTTDIDGMQYKDKDKDKEEDKDKDKDKELKKDVLTNVEKKAEDIAAAAAATLAQRKEKFRSSLDAYRSLYPSYMLDQFFDYWTEPNKSGSKMRFEMERTWAINLRLKTWAAREKVPDKGRNPNVGMILTDNSIEKFKNQKLW